MEIPKDISSPGRTVSRRKGSYLSQKDRREGKISVESGQQLIKIPLHGRITIVANSSVTRSPEFMFRCRYSQKTEMQLSQADMMKTNCQLSSTSAKNTFCSPPDGGMVNILSLFDGIGSVAAVKQ